MTEDSLERNLPFNDAQEDKWASEALELARKIKPMLANRPPEVQGSALAELVAIFMASHAPELRHGQLDAFVDCVKGLTIVAEYEAFGALGHPARQGSFKFEPRGWTSEPGAD